MTRDHATDEALARAWQQGDRRAANRLIARYTRSIDAYLRAHSRGLPVEDLRQDVLVALGDAIHRFRFQSRFRGYLFGIVRRVMLSHLRSRRVGRGRFDASMCSLEEVLGEPSISPDLEAQRDLIEGLHSLSIEQRDLLVLHHALGVTEVELAEIYERPPTTIHGQLVRARRELAALVGSPEDTVRGLGGGSVAGTIESRLRLLGTMLVGGAPVPAAPRVRVWG